MDVEARLDSLESALYHPVQTFFFLIPYTFLAAYLGEVPVATQFWAQLSLIVASAGLLVLDYLLQNFLEQDLIVKLVYLILFIGLCFVVYPYIKTGYLVLLAGREDNFWYFFAGIQVFLFMKWIHFTFKHFSNVFWDLKIV